MSVAKCFTLQSRIKLCFGSTFPWPVVCPSPVHPACPPPRGPHLTLADLEGVFLALLQPGRSPWVVNPGSGTAQRSLFALTLTTAGTPAKRDGTWWGRGMCEPPHLPPHRGIQGPRPQVSPLAHPLVSEDFMVIKPLHCEPPHLRTAFCRYLGKRT